MKPIRRDLGLQLLALYLLFVWPVVLYHYPEGPGSMIGWDFPFRDYCHSAQNTNQPLLSKGRISPTTEQPVATAVIPITYQVFPLTIVLQISGIFMHFPIYDSSI